MKNRNVKTNELNCRKHIANIVGADASACPKKHRGITLIALIITIIVMLILVGVTVSIAINGGLFGMAKDAARQTEKAKIDEQLEIYKSLSYADGLDFKQLLIDNKMINSEELEKNGIAKIGDNENYLGISSDKGLKVISTEVENGNDYSGCTIYLLEDIIFSTEFDNENGELISGEAFKPIGNSNSSIEDESKEGSIKKVFNGKFDGLNHEIKNLYIKEIENTDYCTGLFGYIGENGIVENLTISNSYINGNVETGAIAGRSRGTISNCINNCKINGKHLTGGIAGRNCGIIEDCTNNGELIPRWPQTGGIVGNCDYGEKVIVRNCKNYGKISSAGNSVGGIAGGVWSSTAIVSNCINYGNVGSETNNYIGIGGIVGRSRGTVEECINYGEIKGYSEVGGIAGGIERNENNQTIIKKCRNLSKVTGRYSLVGGICGYNQDIISCSSNNGEVSILGENAYYGVGGIVGLSKSNVNNTRIEYCYNTGKIILNLDDDSKTTNCAGIVGQGGSDGNEYKLELISCYNTGEISCIGTSRPGVSSAGIAGWLQPADVKNCYNIGNLTGENGCTPFGIVWGFRNCEFTNNYWLDSCGASFGIFSSNDGAEPKSEIELKGLANVLGDDYDQDNNINNGYPYLKWQNEK